MAIDVVPLPAARCRDAAAVLAEAFLDDALFAAMFPDRAHRRGKIETYSRWTIRAHQLGGGVVESTASMRGVCLWQPPDHRFPRTLGLRLLPDTLRFLWAMGRDAPRSLGWFTREERRRQALVPGRHWFLVMLGVDPAAQRFGLGAALALHGLARADADHAPTYLITNSSANVALYAKMGFRVVDRTDPTADRLGIPTWRMLRPPS